MKPEKKDIVLFVNAVRPATFEALNEYYQRTNHKLVPVVLVDEKIKNSILKRNSQLQHKDKVIILSADFDSVSSVRAALKDIEGRIFAVTSQYENSIHELKKLIPFLPYLPMPTQSSLDWSTEKKLMRELLEAHNPKLVPKYMQVDDASDKSLNEIEKSMSYPLVVKPSGLEGALLVSMAANRQELKQALQHTFKEVQLGYNTWIKRQKPLILVEEFMVGEMYSIDTYIAADGECYHTPPVRVLTGKNVGYEDFFGYMRITPSGLSEDEILLAKKAAGDACRALNLRSKTAHVELMHTKTGWKIIELGPRIGGYRHDMYWYSYGINHIMNDILIRAGKEPYMPKEVLGCSALFNIYARSEGNLISTQGEEIVDKLESLVYMKRSVVIGERLNFAKNNGDPVYEILMFNKDYSKLVKDIETMEKSLIINVG